jgi:hypothetical protein
MNKLSAKPSAVGQHPVCPTANPGSFQGNMARGLVVDLLENGQILVGVAFDSPQLIHCDWLESEANAGVTIRIGDRVLITCSTTLDSGGIVLGRIGRYGCKPQSTTQDSDEHLCIKAAESLTLTCGESSLQLRKDGKLMILGKDILLRAKRTARVKAGTVAIN